MQLASVTTTISAPEDTTVCALIKSPITRHPYSRLPSLTFFPYNHEQYIASVAALGAEVEDLVRQNNAVDIYEEYFHGSGGDHSSEQPYAKTLTVFRDPCAIKRGASYISWNPDVENRKCAIAYSILGFQQQPEGMALSSYIWDVNAPNKPDFELQGPSQLCCVNYNPKGTLGLSPNPGLLFAHTRLTLFFSFPKTRTCCPAGCTTARLGFSTSGKVRKLYRPNPKTVCRTWSSAPRP